MIKKQLLIGAAFALLLVSLVSCSSTKSANTNDEFLYQSTNSFKPDMTYTFSDFDTSGNRQVNFNEWKKGLTRMLKAYDDDGNGSFERLKGEETYFIEWMHMADKNRDEVISPSEVNEGLKIMFKKASGTNSLISKREFKTFDWLKGESFAKQKNSNIKK